MAGPIASDPATSEPTVHVLPDPAAVGLAAAERIAAILVAAVTRRGRADIATTGGSTPVGIYEHLATAPLRDVVPWDRVHVWFGDDRYVPRDHPLSNVILVDEWLLGGEQRPEVAAEDRPGVPLPFDQLHPFPCAEAIGEARGAAWCAATYADEVRGSIAAGPSGWPAFDLVLVGIGPDGHLLSVFPGSRAIGATELALAIPAPTHVEPHVERVTLNPAILDATHELLAITHGAAKAAVLGDVFGTVRDRHRWPAQLARRPGATWFMDDAAAADLPRAVAGDGD